MIGRGGVQGQGKGQQLMSIFAVNDYIWLATCQSKIYKVTRPRLEREKILPFVPFCGTLSQILPPLPNYDLPTVQKSNWPELFFA